MARPAKAKLAPENARSNHDSNAAMSNQPAPGVPDPTASARLQRLPSKFIRFAVVRERTGLSRSTIWRLERRGDFPKHRRISANAVAWVEEEVQKWITSKIEDVAV
jgi:prophage regulatory protein